MYKFLLLICLAFCAAFSLQAQQRVYLSNQWVQIGDKCHGCGSALFSIEYSQFPDKSGLYWANVNVWSNSFNPNGHLVATYIETPKIFALDLYGNIIRPSLSVQSYFLAHPKTSYFHGVNVLFHVYSRLPNQRYMLEFDNLDDY